MPVRVRPPAPFLVGLDAGAEVKSWGYNQLDDKAAFIADWHVSYTGWGEAYGRGLAQAEDQNVFAKMAEAAQPMPAIEKGNLIPEIAAHIRSRRIKDPIVFQSLRTNLEFNEIRPRELFIPRYSPDCPKAALANLDGFQGVLKYDDLVVPVIDVFVRDPALGDKIIIANVPEFVRWNQFSPAEEPGDEDHIVQMLLVKVTDLNADDAMRNKLVIGNPKWLQEKPTDKREQFLRTHVVVNVYEKYELEITASAAVCLTINAVERE